MASNNGFWRLLLTGSLAVVAAITSQASSQARGESSRTVFINLSDNTVHLARRSYASARSGISEAPGNTSGLAWFDAPGWRQSGWSEIRPGETLVVAPGNYLLRKRGRDLTWNGLDRMSGWAKPNRFELGPTKTENKTAQEIQQLGYERVHYQTFPAGVYRISGEAYRLERKSFNFNFRGLGVKFIVEAFRVPGRVAYYDHDAESRWAKSISWRQGESVVQLNGSVEGRQVRLFGPREPGYYRGNVTVYYTVRSRGGPTGLDGIAIQPRGQRQSDPNPGRRPESFPNERQQSPEDDSDGASDGERIAGAILQGLSEVIEQRQRRQRELRMRPRAIDREADSRPKLGLNVRSVNGRGALVTAVFPGSAASRAGIEVNDYIVAIEGRTVYSASDVLSALSDVASNGQRSASVLVENHRLGHLPINQRHTTVRASW